MEASVELSYIRTTEDFFRKYPELPPIQQSMTTAPPVSHYQIQPASHVPHPPTRPAPALPRQRSSGLLEKAPSEEFSIQSAQALTQSGRIPGLCGLKNNGVSCYISSVVQCLSASAPLRDYLRTFRPGPWSRVPKKAKETTDPPQLLVRNFGNLLGHMWSGGYDFVVPSTFLGYVNAIHMASISQQTPRNQAFGGTARQHDSSEFLMYLITVLHDEMNKKRNRPDYAQQLMSITEVQTEHMNQREKDDFYDKTTDQLDTRDAIRQEWRRKLAGDDSEVSNLFHGMYANLTKCSRPSCRYVKKFWQEFSVLQVPFPPKYTVIGSRFPSVNLAEILGHEFNRDSSDILEDYKCVNCKHSNTCVQDRAVTYLPDYLILEFSRFQVSQEGEGFEARKICTEIKFGPTIDLNAIFIPLNAPFSRPGNSHDVRGCVGPFIYDCYGIIKHIGTGLQSGHYVAYTRNLDMSSQPQGRWHEFNDHAVTEVDFSKTQTRNSHVTHIFMKRRKN